jgi:hypothetical protein
MKRTQHQGILVLLLCATAASGAWGQEGSAVARLSSALPQLFPASSLLEAAEMGLPGARVSTPTAQQLDLGLQQDDVIIAVEGSSLGAETWRSGALASSPTLTVLRRLPGERPVLEPAILARQTLDAFVRLPLQELTPMRLARMLANQQTLVTDGVGVVLVPAASNSDDAAWLRVANPLPEFSENALHDVSKAVRGRVRLPYVEGSEANAASAAFQRQRYSEARERSSRALVEAAADPKMRSDARSLQPLAQIYAESSLEVVRERNELLAPGPRWSLFVEGAYQRVEASPPQNTLFQVDDSDGPTLAVGASVGLFLPTASGGPPLLRNLHLLVEYAVSPRNFEGGTQTDPDRRDPRIETTLHRVSFELAYRPRVLSRCSTTTSSCARASREPSWDGSSAPASTFTAMSAAACASRLWDSCSACSTRSVPERRPVGRMLRTSSFAQNSIARPRRAVRPAAAAMTPSTSST